jgi:hypothetical protein
MKRSAPKEGYDFGNKRQYRRDIWETANHYFYGNISDKKIFMMPSLEGTEIDIAIKKGFSEYNIIICDKEPAYVETLKRKYPKIKTYGVELNRAIERMKADKIELDIMNADLCGPISNKLFDTIKLLSTSGIMRDDSTFIVTILKGRETILNKINNIKMKFLKEAPASLCSIPISKYKFDLEMSGNDYKRISSIMASISGSGFNFTDFKNIYQSPYRAFLFRTKEYQSQSGVMMRWIAIKLHKMPCFCDECYDNFALIINKSFNNFEEKNPYGKLYYDALMLNNYKEYGKERFLIHLSKLPIAPWMKLKYSDKVRSLAKDLSAELN